MRQGQVIIIGFESALEYWRQLRRAPGGVGSEQTWGLYPTEMLLALTEEELWSDCSLLPIPIPRRIGARCRRAANLLGLASPLHVVVGREESRRRAAGAACHAWRGPVSDGLVVWPEDDICVCSPELTWLQMAARVSRIELLQIGLELCGRYACAPRRGAPAEVVEKPITAVERLRKVVETSGHVSGIASARWALRYLTPECRSPMESQMLTLACLPRRMGGCGQALPKVNYRIDVTGVASKLTDRSYFVLDQYYERARLDFEYQGRSEHAGTLKHMEDDERASALLAMGIKVVSFWSVHAYSAERLEGLSELIASRSGKRRRKESAHTKERRRELIDELRLLTMRALSG